MRYLTYILAAAAAHALPEDHLGHETVSAELFLGSSAKPPDDEFLVKRDRTHELAGVSLPEMLGLGIEARQQQRCPYPVMCSSRSCCPSGYKCCNAAVPPLCCPSAYACRLDVYNCCPDTAVTCGGKFCAKQGSICCGQSVCPAGTQCNTNGGTTTCCQPGELKCLGTCCPAGSQCAAQAGYCRRLVLTQTTKTRQTTATRTRIIESTETSTRTRVMTSKVTSTRKTSQTACPANSVAKRGDQHSADVQKRQNLRPNCVYECHNGKTLPVVEVPNIAGQTDQLFLSMCSGILGTSSGRSGDGRNFDVLTYQGANGKALRRSQARCKGYCAKQKAVFSDPSSLQCDEYPPAMAGEGGKGAFRVCIPHSQNSGAQSKLFRRFVTDCAPGKGKQFIVRMKGGCKVRNDKREDVDNTDTAAAQPIVPRADQDPTTFNASSNVLYSWDNMTYMYVPLQELQNGHYRIDVKLGGEVRDVLILDSDGEQYYSSGTVSDDHTVEFDVTDAEADGEESDPVPAGLFLDVDEAVQVSYAATAMLNSTQQNEESRASNSLGFVMVWKICIAFAVALLAV